MLYKQSMLYAGIASDNLGQIHQVMGFDVPTEEKAGVIVIPVPTEHLMPHNVVHVPGSLTETLMYVAYQGKRGTYGSFDSPLRQYDVVIVNDVSKMWNTISLHQFTATDDKHLNLDKDWWLRKQTSLETTYPGFRFVVVLYGPHVKNVRLFCSYLPLRDDVQDLMYLPGYETMSPDNRAFFASRVILGFGREFIGSRPVSVPTFPHVPGWIIPSHVAGFGPMDVNRDLLINAWTVFDTKIEDLNKMEHAPEDIADYLGERYPEIVLMALNISKESDQKPALLLKVINR